MPIAPAEQGLANIGRTGGETADVDMGPVVRELRATFNSGKTHDLAWRKAQLLQIETLVKDNREMMVAAVAKDLGRPRMEGFTGEIMATLGELKFTLANLDKWVKPEKAMHPMAQWPGKSAVVPTPKGVVLIIGPWNFPLGLILVPLLGALAAGNCVVIKPSEVAPACARVIETLLEKYMDPSAVRVIQGGVGETTALLKQQWDHIFYTGNGAVGRVVMRAAAEHLTPVTLELGGKSPVIVDKEANLDVAVRRILGGKYLNNGQVCIAPDYILVDKTVEQQLTEKLKQGITSFYGANPKDSRDLGRIINERHFDRVKRLLESQDGEVLVGGLDQCDRSTNYIPPTLIKAPSESCAIMQEEIFGPLLPILGVDSTEQAIDFVNRREHPLALYVFSQNDNQVQKVIAGTKSGGMCVNDTVFHVANPGLPFGGVGPSGMGAYHGKATFDEFTHRRAVMYRGTWMDPKARYPPYDEAGLKLLEKLFIDGLISPAMKKVLLTALLLGVLAVGAGIKSRL